MPTIFRSRCLKSVWHLARLYSIKTTENAIVIAAAVRSPNSLQWGTGEQQLVGKVVDELVKRTSVPRDEFKKLIVCSSCSDINDSKLRGVAKTLGLKSCKTHAFQNESCSISGLQMCLESLQRDENDWIILSDTRAKCKSKKADIRPGELLTKEASPMWPKAVNNVVQPGQSDEGPGAAAVAMTTAQTAKRLQLQPLAVVREFMIIKNNQDFMHCLNANKTTQLTDIHCWELVVDRALKDQAKTLSALKLKEIHTHDAKQITASHLLTHTVHSLPSGNKGCVIMESGDGQCVLMVLEKVKSKPSKSKSLPQLTLYTKEPCPLCDELVANLEKKFAGEFELKKVFIDRKENVRYLRLFRHDIPVLFLNEQFVCMHSLNEKVLRERLDDLKAEQTKN